MCCSALDQLSLTIVTTRSFHRGPLLVKETKNINFSVAVASPERGVHSQTALTAAEAIVAISKTSSGGEGNFRFTAAANCLAGTPFFPVAYHRGPAAFSIGLESPGLLQ